MNTGALELKRMSASTRILRLRITVCIIPTSYFHNHHAVVLKKLKFFKVMNNETEKNTESLLVEQSQT